MFSPRNLSAYGGFIRGFWVTEDGNEFRPASANLPKNDAVGLVDEIWTNRTNSVWRIGRIEYTSLAENSVHLCKSVSEKNSKIFGFGQKTLARKWITTVSYNCLIQVFYTTVSIQNLSRCRGRGYGKNDHKKRAFFKPQKCTKNHAKSHPLYGDISP